MIYDHNSSLIYPSYLPEGARTKVPRPDEYDISDWEGVTLTTPDKEKLNSYLLYSSKKENPGVTVLFLHGNAGNIVSSIRNQPLKNEIITNWGFTGPSPSNCPNIFRANGLQYCTTPLPVAGSHHGSRACTNI